MGMSLVAILGGLAVLGGISLIPAWRRFKTEAQLDKQGKRLRKRREKEKRLHQRAKKLSFLVTRDKNSIVHPIINFPLLDSQMSNGATDSERTIRKDGFAVVCYENVIPKNLNFSWAFTANMRNDRATAILISLFGVKLVRRFPKIITIESEGDGALHFRRRYKSELRSGIDYTDDVILKVTKKLLEESASLVKKIDVCSLKDVEKRLLSQAQSGHPGAVETLVQYFPESSATKKLLKTVDNNSFVESHGLAPLLTFLLGNDLDGAVGTATNNSYGISTRVRACRALLLKGDEARIPAVLENPPPGMEVELMNALNRPLDKNLQTSLERLLSHRNKEVRQVAISTFGRLGTRDSVVNLSDYLNKVGSRPQLKRAIEVAIASIQDRLVEGGGRGGLSLVEDQNQPGELSLSEGQKGRLALKKKEGVTNPSS